MNGTWMVITALVAFVVTAVSGVWLVPYLRKLKYGQTILDIGPSWHKKKQGTPTMGGIMFVLGITVAVAVGYFYMIGGSAELSPNHSSMTVRLLCGMGMALTFGLIGFFDDYIKVVRRQNLGLTARQKLFMQLATATVYIAVMHLWGGLSTIVDIPFWGQLNLGGFYYPFAILIIITGTVNAVNLTDGVDGLAASVTFVAAVAFMVIASMLRLWVMGLLATALAAGCIGFLVWNFHPAKVFMGDTGSLFLGGVLVALAFGMGLPIFLVPIGIIYIIEAASVMIQVAYFKATGGKRIFKMTPIHHHYEMSGYSETKIVALFSFITAVGSAFAIAAVARL